MKITRRYIQAATLHADGNIRKQYAIQDAAWVWHPQPTPSSGCDTVRFLRRFHLDQPTTLNLHVSGDERYELAIDGRFVSAGPHRCDIDAWSFASFTLELPAGEHTLEARAWRLGDLAPHAQVSFADGFILAVEELPSLNTGQPGWEVTRDTASTFQAYKELFGHYHVIGPEETIQADPGHASATPPCEPATIRQAISDSNTGVRQRGWCLAPSQLPEMMRRPRKLGRVRAIHEGETAHDQAVPENAERHEDIAVWQAMLDGAGSVTVPPHSAVNVIIDPDDYLCAYASAKLRGGEGSDLYFQWAEALFDVDASGQPTRDKGDRAQVIGKRFLGFGDHFCSNGEAQGEAHTFITRWWRAGRMIRITVRTAEAPLVIDELNAIETRYPLEDQATWHSDDASLDDIVPIAVRGIQMCAHETYMDCPYYEQMMYVGDTRLEMLTTYVMSSDDRLPRRGIELFDASRSRTGIVAERYPSEPFQLSCTFAMLWIAMVGDYAMWRDDPAWVRQRMVGVRCVLENLLPLRTRDGLLGRLPGWSFTDWVPEWPSGRPPCADDDQRVSSILNLHLLVALKSAEQLEIAHGEPELAQRYGRLASDIAQRMMSRFFDDTKNLIADEDQKQHYSEHAQVLALLHGCVPDDLMPSVFQSLITTQGLSETTVYFSHYLLETLAQFGRGDLLVSKLDFWKQMRKQGLKTPVEKPRPSRSDCHAWGSHPLFHFHASLAGIRPDAPGFSRIRIAPCPGPLREVTSEIPHPRGVVRAELRFDDQGGCQAAVTLPQGVPGTLAWAGRVYELHERGGVQTVTARA